MVEEINCMSLHNVVLIIEKRLGPIVEEENLNL